MLTEFFKACQDVEKQTFDDLKTIYEIREDFDLFLPYKEKYGQEGLLRNMFCLYQIIYQVQSPNDPLIYWTDFNLEDCLKHKLKENWEKIEKYWDHFKAGEIKLSEVVSKGYELFGNIFLFNLMVLIGQHD